MENLNMNEIKEQAKGFAKTQAANIFSSLLGTLKKSFSFKGRAARLDFWSFVVAALLLNIVFGILTGIFAYVFADFILAVFGIIFALIDIFLLICGISVSVRRLHDLNLTGFWMWYLSPMGLAVVFMVNLLNLDESCESVQDRIVKYCTNWVAWVLLPFFWFWGAPTAMFLLFLYKGKDEANQFGPAVYAEK